MSIADPLAPTLSLLQYIHPFFAALNTKSKAMGTEQDRIYILSDLLTKYVERFLLNSPIGVNHTEFNKLV